MRFEGDDKRKWHIGKEVSVSDVVCLAGACVAVLIAYGKLDTRVSLVEQSLSAQKIDAETTTKRIEASIAEINRKLDRLIERR